MSEIENISLLISNFGFPIVITLYLLVRFEKKFDELESVIRNLAEVISKKE
ncbi:MAG: YvrJ family protein [Lactobacillus sp.]|nr:YvrJ family protein [Lactobacillus sp.]